MSLYRLKYFLERVFPIAIDNVPFYCKIFFMRELPQANEEEQFANGFNPYDCSPSIRIAANHLKLHRFPIRQSTDCVRTKIGYNTGLHVWEIFWPPETRGSHPILGVANKDAPVHGDGYINLVGSNCNSWGWNLNDLFLYHNGECISRYPLVSEMNVDIKKFRKFILILDFFQNTLSFMVKDEAFIPPNYHYLGVAFKFPITDNFLFYPIIQSVYGKSCVEIKYLGGYEKLIIPKLKVLCKLTVIDHLTLKDIDNIPKPLREFIIRNESL
jgi:hypothetical protein